MSQRPAVYHDVVWFPELAIGLKLGLPLYVAIAASVSVNFWPSVAPLTHSRLLSCLLSPSRLNGNFSRNDVI